MRKVTILLFAFATLTLATDFCWKQTKTRDAGVILSTCPEGMEKSGLVCYPKCEQGYTGIGPLCWSQCDANQTDTGTQCQKIAHNRGIGRPLHTCPEGMELSGAFCYTKCKQNYTGVAHICWEDCPEGYSAYGLVCRKGYHIFFKSAYFRDNGQIRGCTDNEEFHQGVCYDKCPANTTGIGPLCWEWCNQNTTDIGLVCMKQAYSRGAGVPLICAPGEEQSGLVCYREKCPKHSSGIGPICWHHCPQNWTDCGAGCGRSAMDCADKILDMTIQTTTSVASIAAMIADAAGGGGHATKAVHAIGQITSFAKKSAFFLAKIHDYATKIQEAQAKAGKPVSSKEAAIDMAKEIFAKVLGSLESKEQHSTLEDSLQMALTIISMVDPTGALAAAQTFMFPTCAELM